MRVCDLLVYSDLRHLTLETCVLCGVVMTRISLSSLIQYVFDQLVCCVLCAVCAVC